MRIKRFVMALFGAALIIFIIWHADISWKRFAGALSSADPLLLAAAFVMTFVIFGAGALKWRWIVRVTSPASRCSVAQLLYFTVLGNVIGLFVPQNLGMLGTRGLALSRCAEMPLTRSFYSVVVDALFDFFILGIFAIPAFMVVGGGLAPLPGMLIAVGLLVSCYIACKAFPSFALGCIIKTWELLARMGSKLPFKKPLFPYEPNSMPPFYDHAVIGWVYLGSYAKFLLLILRTYIVIRAFGLDVSPEVIYFTLPASVLLTAVAATPGGLGVQDAGWYGLLLLQGISPENAALMIVLQRAFSFLAVIAMLPLAWLINWRVEKMGLTTA